MEKCLAFRLGTSRLAMDINAAVEVVTPGKISSVPDMPSHVPGVIKVRGVIIPIIDMRLRLGVKPEPEKERAIIIRSAIGNVGLLVDDVIGIIKFEPEKLRVPPAIFHGIKKKYLSGLYGEGDNVLVIMNTDEILTSREKLVLEKFLK
jgi:purine-binding chemotaxis protein CheW